MTKVLVTGGSGMLGRRIVTKLSAMGYVPRIMSRNRHPASLPSVLSGRRQIWEDPKC